MLHVYDGSGSPPALSGANVRSVRDVAAMRRDIERLWRDGHSRERIGELIGADWEEVDEHLVAMGRSTVYDLRQPTTAITWPRRRARRAA